MNRKIMVLAAAMLFAAFPLKADNYDRVLRRNLWNRGVNVNGIRQDTVGVSQAYLASGVEAGEFHDVNDPAREWNIGAAARSVTHLKKFSLRGSFLFDQNFSYGHCGSMFIDSGRYPVDVIEYTPGTKSRQTYGLTGGISADVASHWRIGLQLDFTARNIAKRKDLRHSNHSLDMQLAPGFLYHDGMFALGLNYIFSRSAETVKAEQVGEKDSYDAFLDKGLMYGAGGVWTDASLHLAEAGINGFPVQENAHGFALQVSAGGFYTQFVYMHAYGVVGEKQSIWFRYPEDRLSLDLAWRISGVHTLGLGIDGFLMKNSETVLEKVSEGGVTVTKEFGSNIIGGRNALTLSPEYVYECGPLYLRAGALLGWNAEMRFPIYPYYVKRSGMSWTVSADAEYELGRFDFGLGIFGSAQNIAETLALQTQDSGVQVSPAYCPLGSAHLDYLKTPSIGANLFVRWSFWRGMFFELDAFGSSGLRSGIMAGKTRGGLTGKFGYNF